MRYGQRVSRIKYLAREYWFELLIAVLAIAAILELIIGRNSPGAPSTALWFAIPAVVVIVLPLLARRRFPFAAPAAYWLLATALTFVDGLLIPFMISLFPVGMASAFLLGNLRDSRQGWTGLAIVLGGITTVVYNIPGHATPELLVIPVDFGISWAAGFALRHRAEKAEAAEIRATRAEREREAAARIAVAEERARIARELHDVVAHAVSVIVLQVGAVRHELPDALAEDRDALRGVEQIGRAALTEMRRLLGAMHDGGEGVEFAPQPGLDRLDALAESVRRAGLRVRLHVEGDAIPLSRAIELSAYRIVQEGLTNSLKHARASRADVTVRYGADGLQLEVRDDGVGLATSDGLGHGLVGIRERVKIYGGEMTAGAAPQGGFVLSARLPLERYQP